MYTTFLESHLDTNALDTNPHKCMTFLGSVFPAQMQRVFKSP